MNSYIFNGWSKELHKLECSGILTFATEIWWWLTGVAYVLTVHVKYDWLDVNKRTYLMFYIIVLYKWWLAYKALLKIFDPNFVKYCPRSKIESNILRTESLFVLLYLKTEQFYKLTNKQLQSCDDYNVARTTVRGQPCVGNSAYRSLFANVTWRDLDQSLSNRVYCHI